LNNDVTVVNFIHDIHCIFLRTGQIAQKMAVYIFIPALWR